MVGVVVFVVVRVVVVGQDLQFVGEEVLKSEQYQDFLVPLGYSLD